MAYAKVSTKYTTGRSAVYNTPRMAGYQDRDFDVARGPAEALPRPAMNPVILGRMGEISTVPISSPSPRIISDPIRVLNPNNYFWGGTPTIDPITGVPVQNLPGAEGPITAQVPGTPSSPTTWWNPNQPVQVMQPGTNGGQWAAAQAGRQAARAAYIQQQQVTAEGENASLLATNPENTSSTITDYVAVRVNGSGQSINAEGQIIPPGMAVSTPTGLTTMPSSGAITDFVAVGYNSAGQGVNAEGQVIPAASIITPAPVTATSTAVAATTDWFSELENWFQEETLIGGVPNFWIAGGTLAALLLLYRPGKK